MLMLGGGSISMANPGCPGLCTWQVSWVRALPPRVLSGLGLKEREKERLSFIYLPLSFPELCCPNLVIMGP